MGLDVCERDVAGGIAWLRHTERLDHVRCAGRPRRLSHGDARLNAIVQWLQWRVVSDSLDAFA
jgi:hypothetical protein